MTRSVFSLNGTWQLRPVERFNQGFYPPDDAGWLEQELPAHWQQHPVLRHHSGKVVYRRRFALPPLVPGRRRWLRCGGIFYTTRLFCNGVDLGRHTGYFIPIEQDITAYLQPENTLLLEVDCPDERDKGGKRLITGVFSHWDCLDPTTNPGGPWLPIEILETGPLHIVDLQLRTAHIEEERATLTYRLTIDSAAAGPAILHWRFMPATFDGPPLATQLEWQALRGRQQLEGTLVLRQPRLWWTHDLGRPDLYDVTAGIAFAGERSDERRLRFGIRTFELRDWIPHLNGVRLLVKGNNYAPGDTRIATMTPERAAADMALAKGCHLNLLRVHAHIDHPALYDAADEAGMLLWQDFPLQWSYQRGIKAEAQRQIREMVRLLGNHPSVTVWCCHNEPISVVDTADTSRAAALRAAFSLFIWSWDREVLDTALQETVEQEDPFRPVVRSSGEYAIPLLRKGSDTHFYFGWYYGKLRDFDWVARHLPDTIRFVTEFGAQSFPNVESCRRFMADRLEDVDWEELRRRHSFQPKIMARWYDWRACRTLEELVERSQSYQAELNRFYIDRLRLRKYRPVGGIVPFMFQDPNPAVQWSVLDYWRIPKASYWALRDALSPQYCFAILDRDSFPAGAELSIPVYAVNDAHRAVKMAISAALREPDGSALVEWEDERTLPADGPAEEIWRLRFVPANAGSYTLELRIRPEGGEELINRYTVEVLRLE